MDMSYFQEQMLFEAPYILTCIGGIVVAFILWQRAPSSSVCVPVACGATLFFLVLHPIAWEIVIRIFQRNAVNTIFAVFWSIERAFFAILLLFAVYLERTKR